MLPDPSRAFAGIANGPITISLLSSLRQRSIYHSCTKVPRELSSSIDAETFEKARLYALDKSNFGAVQGVFTQLLSTAIMWYMGFKEVWDLAGESRGKETKPD